MPNVTQPPKDDWQDQLQPRRVTFVDNGQSEWDDVQKQLGQIKGPLNSIKDFLKDAAHFGKAMDHGFFLQPAKIPNSNEVVYCQYRFDDRTVYIHFVWTEKVPG